MIMKAENIDINSKEKGKRLIKKKFWKLEKEYTDCIKRKWRQDWDMRHCDTSCGPMSCIPTRKDGVPELVIKFLYCRAVV